MSHFWRQNSNSKVRKKCKTSFCPYLPIHHDNEGGFLSSLTHRFCITFTGFSTAEVFEFCSQFQWVSTSVLKKLWKIKNLEFFIHFGFFFHLWIFGQFWSYTHFRMFNFRIITGKITQWLRVSRLGSCSLF